EEQKRTEQTVEFETPHAGQYRIDINFTIGGWQEFGGAYDFTANVAAIELARKRLDVGGYKKHAFSKAIDLAAGKQTLVLATEAKQPDAKGMLRHLELRPTVRIVGPLGKEFAEYPEVHRKIFFDGEPPAQPKARRAYARQILERFA